MNILKSKKGVAIENALLFMMIIFGLCFLVSFVALIGHHQYRLDNTLIENRVELDQIGEDYLSDGASLEKTYANYAYEAEENTLKVWRASDPQKTVVLYVEYVEIDGDRKPTVWRYSEPQP